MLLLLHCLDTLENIYSAVLCARGFGWMVVVGGFVVYARVRCNDNRDKWRVVSHFYRFSHYIHATVSAFTFREFCCVYARGHALIRVVFVCVWFLNALPANTPER